MNIRNTNSKIVYDSKLNYGHYHYKKIIWPYKLQIVEYKRVRIMTNANKDLIKIINIDLLFLVVFICSSGHA